MNRADWKAAISRLAPGMSYAQAAKQIGMGYPATRKWLLEFGYKAKDARSNGARKLDAMRQFAGVDWRKSNIGLALELGVTREWVRQVRNRLGRTKVESRGRKCQ